MGMKNDAQDTGALQEAQDRRWMQLALGHARRGQGTVEPNPMVGCVLVADGRVVGEGFHAVYGEDHAEANALLAAGSRAKGATAYVTLEPCCHWGKTPPCADALIRAGVARVVVAMRDPFPKVDGGGIQKLRDAGISVTEGVSQREAMALNAPYLKLVTCGRPFVTAKWAMTLDGKIATRTGSSRWISSEESRERGHRLRSRVDAILVGVGTVLLDDPLLTARCRGEAPNRTLTRIVADSRLETPLGSRLVQTAREYPVLLLVGPSVTSERTAPFEKAGCEIFRSDKELHPQQLLDLLDELGRRRTTNLLVEGGSSVLGGMFDLREVDEVQVFIAAKVSGGRDAVTAVGGEGIALMESAFALTATRTEILGSDVCISGRVSYPEMDPDARPDVVAGLKCLEA